MFGRVMRRSEDTTLFRSVGVRGAAEALVGAAQAGGAEAVFVASADEAGEWLKANVRAGDAEIGRHDALPICGCARRGGGFGRRGAGWWCGGGVCGQRG